MNSRNVCCVWHCMNTKNAETISFCGGFYVIKMDFVTCRKMCKYERINMINKICFLVYILPF